MEPIFDHDKLDVYALELQFVTWTTDFLEEVPNRQSHAGASWLINSIERPYPFCSIPPKETENARAPKELDTSMTPAAQPWNVQRAWMPRWLNESQRAIESVLAKSYWPES